VARTVATEYFVRSGRRIRVGTIYKCVPMFSGICVFGTCRTNSCWARVYEAGTECVFSDYCNILISILKFVYVKWFGQQEARKTWQLLKLLPGDLHHNILEDMLD
jgi:hypothetical protein